MYLQSLFINDQHYFYFRLAARRSEAPRLPHRKPKFAAISTRE